VTQFPGSHQCSVLRLMAEKYFKREEAEELLPIIEQGLQEARRHKQKADVLRAEIVAAASRIMIMGGSFPSYAELAGKKAEHDNASQELMKVVETIQETGCVVKDLEAGLVDFPTLRRGEEVYLCWKLGEERIGYWHGLEEGFAGRKPLDEPRPETRPPRPPRVQ
jgi:hypothetical protein